MVNERRGGDRRSTDVQQSQQIGELVGTLNEVKANFLEMRQEMEDTRTLVLKLQSDVALKFKTAETVFKTLKFIGLAVIAVLTFKFGDIRVLWSTFFG